MTIMERPLLAQLVNHLHLGFDLLWRGVGGRAECGERGFVRGLFGEGSEVPGEVVSLLGGDLRGRGVGCCGALGGGCIVSLFVKHGIESKATGLTSPNAKIPSAPLSAKNSSTSKPRLLLCASPILAIRLRVSARPTFPYRYGYSSRREH